MTVAELRARRADLVDELHARMAAAEEAMGTDDEEARHGEFVEAKRAIEAHDERIERAEAMSRARETYKPLPEEPKVETEERAREGGIDAVVKSEAPIYHPGQDGQGFFSDLYRAKNGDRDALERLERNNKMVRDDLTEAIKTAPDLRTRMQYEKQLRAGVNQTAGSGGEFIPPTWLNQQWVPLLRAGRAFADQCITQPLLDGTNQINVPKITTGNSTAVQTDGGAVSNTDLVTTSVTAQYQTIAGRTIGSRAHFDFGVPSQDVVIFTDLAASYAKTLDVAVLNGTVTNAKGVLQVSGTNAITYTDASPTVPELFPSIFQARSAIAKNAFMPADFVVMHPSTWNWYLSALDSQNRPLAESTNGAAFNALAAFNPEAQGPSGNLSGIPVIEDANVPVNLGGGTNQAPIIMCNRSTLFLYENAPVMRLADQTSIANLQLQYVMWGYYAVAFGRHPEAISIINGTGMIVQSGY